MLIILEVTSHKIPFAETVGELQLKNYLSFMGNYAQQLSDIEVALNEHPTHTWNKNLAPIVLQASLH